MSETTAERAKPAGINHWITKKTAAGPLGGGQGGIGQPFEVELDLLDPNPKQPRREMDPGELAELSDSLRQHGPIQPIVVVRQPDGRFIIVAGHRRTEAMRLLRANAAEADKAKWSRIPAYDRGPTVMDDLAELAITENIQRADLQPMETAEALADLKEQKKLSTEQLAERLGLELTKTKRFLQLAGAPPAVRQAMGKGMMVEVADPEEPGAKAKREHRHLELSHAILVVRAHAHWVRTKPKKAVELTRGLVEKVLLEGWTHRRLKDHVDSLVGRDGPTEDKPQAGSSVAESDSAARKQALFQDEPKRLIINRTRLTEASAEERTALKAVLQELVTQL